MAIPANHSFQQRLTRLQEWSLYGALFTIPFFRLGTEILGAASLTPAKIFLGLTFLIWVINILLNKKTGGFIALFQEKAAIFLILFLVVTFMSLIFTRHFETETAAELALRIKTGLLFFLMIGIVTRRKILKVAITAFLLGSLLTTGAGLYEAGTGNAFFKQSYRHGDFQKAKEGLLQTTYGGTGRVQGFYSDAGYHAHAMVIFIGLALPWVFYARRKGIRMIMGLLVIAYLVNLIGTGARVGWVSMGCALMVFLFFMKHRHKYSLWALSVIAVVTVFAASSLISHLPTTERLHLKGDISWSWRLDTNRQGLDMVMDHPVLGVGTGNYLIEYFNYLDRHPHLSRIMMGFLHNSYLQVWVENGTVGLIVFLAFMGTMAMGLVRIYMGPADPEMKVLALGLMTAFAGYAVEFAGVPVIGQEMGWVLFGFCAALIAIHRKEQRAPAHATQRP